MRRALFLVVILVLAAFESISARDDATGLPDVLVYGATPAGIAAALAAAESDLDVLLIEPTARIGGMTTHGLSHSDFHSFEALSGPFLQFSQRVT